MSRSWERAVRKNTKLVNQQRKKSGTPVLGPASYAIIRGRNWMFPSMLLMIVFFLLISGRGTTTEGTYWLTVIGYTVMAFLIFLWRRPYLKLYKNQLATRKWTGEKYAAANDIEKIALLPGYVIIHIKGKRRRWVFSRMMHVYPMQTLVERLLEFANQNQVAVEIATKTAKGK